jgi:Rrf2 family protein
MASLTTVCAAAASSEAKLMAASVPVSRPLMMPGLFSRYSVLTMMWVVTNCPLGPQSPVFGLSRVRVYGAMSTKIVKIAGTMWITRRTDYATRAVLALTLAGPDRTMTLKELAERTETPRSVADQVMLQLRSAGLVRSERGPAGGYRLNHDPADITMERVVRIFEGQLAPIGCATRKEPEPCPMDEGCSLRTVWGEVREATIGILERTTFAELAAQAGGRWPEVVAVPDPVAKGSKKGSPAAG